MSFDIRFKRTESSEPVNLDYNEFKARIQRSEIGPTSLVCDRVLTGNEWWPVDELNVFHVHSPVSHPAGPRLQKKRDDAKYWQERTERSWALLGDYIHGDLVDRSFQLAPLAELIKRSNTNGATRLYVFRSFEPERIFTFLFQHTEIAIEVCQGRTSLWSSLPQVGSLKGVMSEQAGPPFEPAHIHRASAELCYERAPEPFNHWAAVSTASQLAPSCSTPALDGVSFRHEVLLPNDSSMAEWGNPHGAEQEPQTKLLKAYQALIVEAKLGCFWQGKSPGDPETRG